MTSRTRGVRESTLAKRLARWKPVLKLSSWDITIRYAKKAELEKEQKKELKDRIILAFVIDCDPAAKRATVLVNRDYHKVAGHKQSWNIDTLILHELVHIVLWGKSDAIPEKIRNHSKVDDLEEFACDAFADIIYCIYYNRL